MRYLITEEIWDRFGPMVERCTSPLGPEPEISERMFFEAILYWARTGGTCLGSLAGGTPSITASGGGSAQGDSTSCSL